MNCLRFIHLCFRPSFKVINQSELCKLEVLGLVVRGPIGANLGLNFNPGF